MKKKERDNEEWVKYEERMKNERQIEKKRERKKVKMLRTEERR